MRRYNEEIEMKKIAMLALACAAVLALGACKEKTTADKIGDVVDSAKSDVQKAAADTADKAADAADKAADAVKK